MNETTLHAPTGKVVTEPDFSGRPQLIEEFAGRPDFPQCALGAYLDIRGFEGVLVEIINHSIKVRSSEGVTQQFNIYRLKTLFAPPERIEAMSETRSTVQPNSGTSPSPSRPDPLAPPRIYIADPNFTAPVRPINDYAIQPDFPQCTYGKHVDIVGYTGVVVEIVKGSLKIQSRAGTTRSYNGGVLKKLYGQT